MWSASACAGRAPTRKGAVTCGSGQRTACSGRFARRRSRAEGLVKGPFGLGSTSADTRTRANTLGAQTHTQTRQARVHLRAARRGQAGGTHQRCSLVAGERATCRGVWASKEWRGQRWRHKEGEQEACRPTGEHACTRARALRTAMQAKGLGPFWWGGSGWERANPCTKAHKAAPLRARGKRD